ncbi:MAG: glycosyltransferase family 2 protein [Ruminococcaceae bacterium]|nr:glycosyltransferase family 2 protein [Oscillospiraceae bacterium]
MGDKIISIVVSVYNEEESLDKFYKETLLVLEGLTWDYELVFVNDGSVDKSRTMLDAFAHENKKVKVINFSRNFGHEAAMIAGIDYAKGDCIVCMDADLQHPPQSIPQIIKKFEEGYEIVSMVRSSRADGGYIKKITSAFFYKILNMLSPIKFERNASDFFAISNKVAHVLRTNYREQVRYLRGFVQSVGFKKATLAYDAQSRVAGESKYNIRKLIQFSVTTICSFSDMPLKLGIYSGLFVALFGVVLMIYTIIQKFVHDAPGGYSTIIVAMCFMFAILLGVIGIIGQYISVLFIEIKKRPMYIIDETKNMNDSLN